MPSIIQTMRSGGTLHPEEIMNFLTNRNVKGKGGVYDREDDGLKVIATTPATMNLEVSEGYAVVSDDATEMAYPVRIYGGNYSLTVTANGTGNPRIDVVVLYIDLAASANATVTNVAKLAVVAGTAAASPSAPNDTVIKASIGASNPYIILSQIAVASGATSIVTANITDLRGKPSIVIPRSYQVTNDYSISYSIVTDHLTISLKDKDGKDFSLSNVGYMEIDGELLTLNSALSVELQDTDSYILDYNFGNDKDVFVYIINNNGTAQLGVSSSPIHRTVSSPYTDSAGLTGTIQDNKPLVVMSGTRNATNDCKVMGRLRVKQASDYDWEAPSADSIINFPIYRTEWTTWTLDLWSSQGITAPTTYAYYQVEGNLIYFSIWLAVTTGNPFDPIQVSSRLPLCTPLGVYSGMIPTSANNGGTITMGKFTINGHIFTILKDITGGVFSKSTAIETSVMGSLPIKNT